MPLWCLQLDPGSGTNYSCSSPVVSNVVVAATSASAALTCTLPA